MKKSKENKLFKSSRGITLIPLIITASVILIVVSVAIENGLYSTENAQLQNFFRELQIIQKRVDIIYEEARAGANVYITYDESNKVFNSDNIGTIVSSGVNIPGIDNNEGYYSYTSEELKLLGVEDIDQEVFINWKTRDVVSKIGFTAKGTTYYRDTSTYKPEYIEDEAKDITITIAKEINGDIKKLTVTEVKTEDDVVITNFTLKYKLDGETAWRIADYNYFKTPNSGKYYIQVSGNGINSKEEVVFLYTLPDNYQQVEYIASTGTQYIDTGYVPKSQNVKLIMDFQVNEYTNINNNNYGDIFGLNSTSAPSLLLYQQLYGTYKYFSVRNGEYETTQLFGGTLSEYNVFNKYHLEFSKTTSIIDSDRGENTITVADYDLSTNTNSIYLFEARLSDVYKNLNGIKIYFCEIYNENNALVRKLIPCYRKSDNVIGMYDLVNDTFYDNKGTGTFSKGNEV